MDRIFKKSVLFVLLAALVPVLPLTAFGQEVAKEEEVKLEGEIIGVGEDYTLGKGDVIEVTVRNQPEFSGMYIVGPEGDIQYTFIGDINVKGLTKREVQNKLTTVLDKYVKIPEVGVAIRDYKSKYIFVFGEVNRPGKYPMQGDTMSLRDALVEAGLPTLDAAVRRVIVVKPDRAKPIYTKVDILKLVYKGQMDHDITLTTGDVVFVPSTVPTELNRALTKLLSPFSQTLVLDEFITRSMRK